MELAVVTGTAPVKSYETVRTTPRWRIMRPLVSDHRRMNEGTFCKWVFLRGPSTAPISDASLTLAHDPRAQKLHPLGESPFGRSFPLMALPLPRK